MHTPSMLCRLLLLVPLVTLAASAELTVTAGDPLSWKSESERSAVVEALWQASQVAIPEGPLALSLAIERLCVNGNTVMLDPAVDAAQIRASPGFHGDWWSAVLAVGELYGLDLAEDAEPDSNERMTGNHEGQPLPASASRVVLKLRDRSDSPPRQVCGPLLLEVEELTLITREGGAGRWADFGLRARIEPRLATRGMGRLTVQWGQARVDGVAAALSPRSRAGLARLRLSGLSEDARQVQLIGAITVHAQLPLRVETSLQPGDSAHIDLGEQRMLLSLLNAEQARTAGKRAPCVNLSYPAGALSSVAELRVLADGKQLPNHGMSTRVRKANDYEQTQYFTALADIVHQVVIEAIQPLAEVELPLTLELDLTTLPTTPIASAVGEANDVATQIALPDAELALSEAVQLLRLGGNEVLVELGVDAHERAQVSAARLGFWEAVLTVAQMFKLDLMPPQITENANLERVQDDGSRGEAVQICGGPLGLGRLDGDAPLQRSACGPLLIEVMHIERIERRSLEGSAHLADIQLRLRLEPRIAHDLVAEARMVWSSAIASELGERLPLRPADMEDGELVFQTPARTGLHTVQVSGLSQTTRQFALAGQLRLRLQRQVRNESLLELDQPASAIRLGSLPLSLALVSGQDGELSAVKLVYAPNRLGKDLQVTVRGPDGIELARRGRSSHSSGQRQTDLWLMAGVQAGIRYSVTLASSETVATPVIALTVPINMP